MSEVSRDVQIDLKEDACLFREVARREVFIRGHLCRKRLPRKDLNAKTKSGRRNRRSASPRNVPEKRLSLVQLSDSFSLALCQKMFTATSSTNQNFFFTMRYWSQCCAKFSEPLLISVFSPLPPCKLDECQDMQAHSGSAYQAP